jgi:DNA adenine methylase
MYDRPGIYIERVTRLNNMKQRYDGGAQFPELFVSNYDQSERIRVLPEQLSFAS